MAEPTPGKTEAPLDVDEVQIDPALALKLAPAVALRRRMLPLARIDGILHVACANSSDREGLRLVEQACGGPIEARRAESASLDRALKRTYAGLLASRRSSASPVGGAEPGADDARALCDELLQAAALRGASDIHIDPDEARLRLRFRVDGELETFRELPMARFQGLSSRLKVLAGMDIAEKRAPQDGRFRHELGPDRRVEIRAATLPTRHGERLTLRLLAIGETEHGLGSLGMAPEDLETFDRTLQRPRGLVLVTGPTGSGKSTTLYAALTRLLELRPINIITIEDPIERDLRGVAQVEVDQADKVSFSKALRSVLRHDPDVVMIGEIRDRETADTAVKSALTGHLVLSTLHTNSAASAVTRLCDIGVERYLLSATLRLAVAQRLVRKLCERCRRPVELSAEDALLLGVATRGDALLTGATVYQPGGCLACAGRGRTGRIGLFELLSVDAELARLIHAGADEDALESAARDGPNGARPLSVDAREKVLAGSIDLDELRRVVTSF